MKKDREREQARQYATWCDQFAAVPADYTPRLKEGLKPEIELAPMRWMRLGLDLIKSAHGTTPIQLFDNKEGPQLQTFLPYPVFQAGTEVFLKGMWLATHAECRNVEASDYVPSDTRKMYQKSLKLLGHDLLRIITALEQEPLYREEANVAKFLKIISGVTRTFYYPLTEEDAAWAHARYPRRFYDDTNKVAHADQFKSYPEQWTLVLLFEDTLHRVDRLWGITAGLAKRARNGNL